MQRVSAELIEAFRNHPGVCLTTSEMRSSWKDIGKNTTLFLSKLLLSLPNVSKRERVDVILFSSLVTASLTPALRPRLPGHVRLAGIAHGLDATLPVSAYQFWLPHVFGTLDRVLPVSTATADACIARGAAPSHVYVCHNGIDVSRFESAPLQQEARRSLRGRLGLPPEARLLLSVGRQVQRKGTAWFVEHVLPSLPDSTRYLVVGDGPEVERIRMAARSVGVSPQLYLLGRIPDDDLQTALHGADLFVMPNVRVAGDMEGYGVVLLEAGLAGLYTVASRIEGIQDAIEEGRTGTLVPPHDAEAFAKRITRLLKDPGTLRRLSMQAQAVVRDEKSWQNAADRYVQVLSNVSSPSLSADH